MLHPSDPALGLRRIIHIDMDAFHASVEQRGDPALRGGPVAGAQIWCALCNVLGHGHRGQHGYREPKQVIGKEAIHYEFSCEPHGGPDVSTSALACVGRSQNRVVSNRSTWI